VARRRGPAEIRQPGRNRIEGPQPDERPRFGFLASKGVGSAVDRNRAKRLLRQAVRGGQAQVAPGWDLVLIARKPLIRACQAEVDRALADLMRRAGVLRQV